MDVTADHASLEDLTLPPAWQWLPPAPLQLFATCNLPRLDMNFLLAPDAQLDSGERPSCTDWLQLPRHGLWKIEAAPL